MRKAKDDQVSLRTHQSETVVKAFSLERTSREHFSKNEFLGTILDGFVSYLRSARPAFLALTKLIEQLLGRALDAGHPAVRIPLELFEQIPVRHPSGCSRQEMRCDL